MNDSGRPHPEIAAFLSDIPWQNYVGATFAYAGLFRDGHVRNLDCRIVLRTRVAPEGWKFEDTVESLVIRRGWIPIDDLPKTLSVLHRHRLVLAGHELWFLDQQGSSYGWTRLLEDQRGHELIQWRATSLIGVGSNQYSLLGYESFRRLGDRLRTATRRPFAGWPNLGAFLGEGERPLELGEQSNTRFECFVPAYARIARCTLTSDGSLEVLVERTAAETAGELRIQLESAGADPPRMLDLKPDPREPMWRSYARLSPIPDRARVTLLLGDRVADEATTEREAQPQAIVPLLESAKASQSHPASHNSGDDQTLVDRWLHRIKNNPVVAVLVVFGAVVIALGTFSEKFKKILEVFGSKRTPSSLSSVESFGSDRTWKASGQFDPRWRSIDFDDSRWQVAVAPAKQGLAGLTFGATANHVGRRARQYSRGDVSENYRVA